MVPQPAPTRRPRSTGRDVDVTARHRLEGDGASGAGRSRSSLMPGFERARGRHLGQIPEAPRPGVARPRPHGCERHRGSVLPGARRRAGLRPRPSRAGRTLTRRDGGAATSLVVPGGAMVRAAAEHAHRRLDRVDEHVHVDIDVPRARRCTTPRRRPRRRRAAASDRIVSTSSQGRRLRRRVFGPAPAITPGANIRRLRQPDPDPAGPGTAGGLRPGRRPARRAETAPVGRGTSHRTSTSTLEASPMRRRDRAVGQGAPHPAGRGGRDRRRGRGRVEADDRAPAHHRGAELPHRTTCGPMRPSASWAGPSPRSLRRSPPPSSTSATLDSTRER